MARPGLPIVITVVVATLIAGFLAVQLRAERQSVAQLRERAAALALAQAQAKTATSTAPPVEGAAPEAPAPEAEMPAREPEEVSSQVPAKAAARQQIVVMRADGTPDPDPTAGARFQIGMFWGDVEKDLGLSKEEMEALVQLVARGNPTPAEFDAATGGRWAQLQERQWDGLAMNRVSSLRNALASTPNPLTDEQEQQLKLAFTAEFRRTGAEEAANPRPTEPRALLEYEEQRLRSTEAGNERIVAATRSHLSSEQVAVVQSTLEIFVNLQRRNLESRRLRLEAGGSGAMNPEPLIVYPASSIRPR